MRSNFVIISRALGKTKRPSLEKSVEIGNASEKYLELCLRRFVQFERAGMETSGSNHARKVSGFSWPIRNNRI